MIAEVSSPPERTGRTPRQRRASGIVVPHPPRWYQRLGAWLIYALVRTVAATLRYRWKDQSGYFDGPPPGPAIYCVWHNRLALCLIAYYGYAKKRNATPGMAALVSASKDGGFLAAILERFKVQPVRGSSSRRGPQALLELTTWAERGYDLAITPDGPRGPRYIVQEGVMSLAQITGLPIIPSSYSLNWKLQVKSWDQFQIPLPFSRCEMVIEKPICVSREATDAEREQLRQQLERTLRSISKD
ncbi:MAG TPA: lysophospholipid acyltransferase family protein [Candidatus Sulfotelmatobacter sp.]|nr:lysophospholipid acyltransferase family protein [Candidatus Sulfotelmatobacter sp.]